MRSSLDSKAILGILALLVTFALAFPGVKAVRAEDGAQCNAVSAEAGSAQAGDTVARLQAALEAQIAAEGGPNEGTPVLLNGRGYNYGPGTDIQRIAADAERLRAHR